MALCEIARLSSRASGILGTGLGSFTPAPIYKHLFRVMVSRTHQCKPAIEVERKFRLFPECKLRLKAMGAVFVDHVVFIDRYVDTDALCLTSNDFWLRQRNNVWQLKYKATWQVSSPAHTTTQLESDCEEDITRAVSPLIGTQDHTKAVSLDCFLTDHKFQTLAEFQTSRRSYAIDGLSVVLDETNFGYCVGEIEAMTDDRTAADQARIRIDELATKLGVLMEEAVPGKIDVYLHKERPDVFDRLLEAEICMPIKHDD